MSEALNWEHAICHVSAYLFIQGLTSRLSLALYGLLPAVWLSALLKILLFQPASTTALLWSKPATTLLLATPRFTPPPFLLYSSFSFSLWVRPAGLSFREAVWRIPYCKPPVHLKWIQSSAPFWKKLEYYYHFIFSLCFIHAFHVFVRMNSHIWRIGVSGWEWTQLMCLCLVIRIKARISISQESGSAFW